MALLAALALGGCMSLPKDVERPVSTALTDSSGTALAGIVQNLRAQQSSRSPSGFQLLSGPQAAYGSRLALVQMAQKTLDLQYYAIHADESTERLLRGVVDAAQRGVRVRVLLDDFHSTGDDAQVMRLAFVPGIEMRMFNPVAGARDSLLGRAAGILSNVSRVQQRMHNKLFIADNIMGIAGGRNLGDAYFGNDDKSNFVDLDVLAIGPIVKELSTSFDSYWNNQRAYPVQSLITPGTLKRMRNLSRSEPDHSSKGSSSDRSPMPTAAAATPEPGGSSYTSSSEASSRSQIWDEQAMDLSQSRFVWAPAVVLADKPAKIQPESGASNRPADEEESLLLPPPIDPAPPAAANPAASALPAGNLRNTAERVAAGDTVVTGLLHLFQSAQNDLLIVSPYFVPGEDMKKAFAAALQRGARVRVLTNSLASNDAPIAHVGYARHREELLKMGVELYEMRSDLNRLRDALKSTTGSQGGASRAMLHSKLLVIDSRLLVVGSMNLDLRSQWQNTEIALLIASRDLAGPAADYINEALDSESWHVEKDDKGLIWHAPKGSGLADSRTEPDTSLPLRLLLRLFGPFAPDEML